MHILTDVKNSIFKNKTPEKFPGFVGPLGLEPRLF